ncbi:hypothetical protein ACLOJK_022850 [Asimina triloba]
MAMCILLWSDFVVNGLKEPCLLVNLVSKFELAREGRWAAKMRSVLQLRSKVLAVKHLSRNHKSNKEAVALGQEWDNP